MKMEQSVPKRRHIKFSRWGIARKKVYAISHFLIELNRLYTIDSCHSTIGYISNMFRSCLAIIRLTKVSINVSLMMAKQGRNMLLM